MLNIVRGKGWSKVELKSYNRIFYTLRISLKLRLKRKLLQFSKIATKL